MSISICTVTQGKPYAKKHLQEFSKLAKDLDGELVIVGDGSKGIDLAEQYSETVLPIPIAGKLPETVIAPLARACIGKWVFRIDDDESFSPALAAWLQEKSWLAGKEEMYSFPRAWLWGDVKTFITTDPFFPDIQVRLMPRELTELWTIKVHGSIPFGSGTTIPAAICHHSFLYKPIAERLETAQAYDRLKPGAGTGNHFGRYFLPERFFTELQVRDLETGEVNVEGWCNTGRSVKI